MSTRCVYIVVALSNSVAALGLDSNDLRDGQRFSTDRTAEVFMLPQDDQDHDLYALT